VKEQRSWKFEPYVVDGKKVSISTSFTVLESIAAALDARRSLTSADRAVRRRPVHHYDMTEKLLPITGYLLRVHEPTKNEGPGSRDPVTGAMTLPAFTSRTLFVPASHPFPTPHVGDEIEVAFEDVGNEHAYASRAHVVTRVRHRVNVKPDGIVCTTDVYTEQREARGG